MDAREGIIKVLTENNVDFPPTANIIQLRRLLQNIVGVGDNSSANTMNTTPNTNILDNIPDEMIEINAPVSIESSAAIAVTAVYTAATAVPTASTTDVLVEFNSTPAVHDVFAAATAVCSAAATVCSDATAVHTAATVVPTTSTTDVLVEFNSTPAVHDVFAAAATVCSAATAATAGPTVFTTDVLVEFNSTPAVHDVFAATPSNSAPIDARATTISVDDELVALQKRMEMLKLMKEIDELRASTWVQQQRRLDFADIEHAMPKFSGDDLSVTVGHFLQDFEEVMKSSRVDERFKLLALRRCLVGTANVFLTTTKALSYAELKKALTMEFDVPIQRNEVYKMLARRKWDKNSESLHRYVLLMQAIGKRANICETEIIDFIIDGIGNIVPNAHLLLPAKTLDELKALVSRFQRKYFTVEPGVGTKHTNAAKTSNDPQPLQKCYNCSRVRHIKPQCPYPLRPTGSCFRC
ncbi:uncharacterized protein [Eurosta solidaginis]|uniref:uncharacterized protein n=1 Tax=Eurosta solidaginis TaxID=178769 RepID=UPI00353172C8